jgi:chromosome segregation ATPase
MKALAEWEERVAGLRDELDRLERELAEQTATLQKANAEAARVERQREVETVRRDRLRSRRRLAP